MQCQTPALTNSLLSDAFHQVWGLMYANVRGKDLKLYVWRETQLVSGKDCAAVTNEHLAVISAWIKCHSLYSPLHKPLAPLFTMNGKC